MSSTMNNIDSKYVDTTTMVVDGFQVFVGIFCNEGPLAISAVELMAKVKETCEVMKSQNVFLTKFKYKDTEFIIKNPSLAAALAEVIGPQQFVREVEKVVPPGHVYHQDALEQPLSTAPVPMVAENAVNGTEKLCNVNGLASEPDGSPLSIMPASSPAESVVTVLNELAPLDIADIQKFVTENAQNEVQKVFHQIINEVMDGKLDNIQAGTNVVCAIRRLMNRRDFYRAEVELMRARVSDVPKNPFFELAILMYPSILDKKEFEYHPMPTFQGVVEAITLMAEAGIQVHWTLGKSSLWTVVDVAMGRLKIKNGVLQVCRAAQVPVDVVDAEHKVLQTNIFVPHASKLSNGPQAPPGFEHMQPIAANGSKSDVPPGFEQVLDGSYEGPTGEEIYFAWLEENFGINRKEKEPVFHHYYSGKPDYKLGDADPNAGAKDNIWATDLSTYSNNFLGAGSRDASSVSSSVQHVFEPAYTAHNHGLNAQIQAEQRTLYEQQHYWADGDCDDKSSYASTDSFEDSDDETTSSEGQCEVHEDGYYHPRVKRASMSDITRLEQMAEEGFDPESELSSSSSTAGDEECSTPIISDDTQATQLTTTSSKVSAEDLAWLKDNLIRIADKQAAKAAGKKIFQFDPSGPEFLPRGFGKVFGKPTIWCETYRFSAKPMSEWPSDHEFEYEGQGRIESKFEGKKLRRCMPIPRIPDPNVTEEFKLAEPSWWKVLKECQAHELDNVYPKPTFESIYTRPEEIPEFAAHHYLQVVLDAVNMPVY